MGAHDVFEQADECLRMDVGRVALAGKSLRSRAHLLETRAIGEQAVEDAGEVGRVAGHEELPGARPFDHVPHRAQA